MGNYYYCPGAIISRLFFWVFANTPLSCPSHILMHWTRQIPTHPSTIYFSEPKKLNWTRENHTTMQMEPLLADHADPSQDSQPDLTWYGISLQSLFSHCLNHLVPTFLHSTQTFIFPLTLSWWLCSIHPKENRSHHTGTRSMKPE